MVRLTREALLADTEIDADSLPGDDVLVPEAEYGEERGVTTRALRKEREKGGGPEYVRLGRSVYYTRGAIRRHHKARTFRSRAAEIVAAQLAA
jgi:hypothetical protein